MSIPGVGSHQCERHNPLVRVTTPPRVKKKRLLQTGELPHWNYRSPHRPILRTSEQRVRLRMKAGSSLSCWVELCALTRGSMVGVPPDIEQVSVQTYFVVIPNGSDRSVYRRAAPRLDWPPLDQPWSADALWSTWTRSPSFRDAYPGLRAQGQARVPGATSANGPRNAWCKSRDLPAEICFGRLYQNG